MHKHRLGAGPGAAGCGCGSGAGFRYINDFTGIGERNNVAFFTAFDRDELMPYVVVRAVVDIQAGDELLTDYGEACVPPWPPVLAKAARLCTGLRLMTGPQ